ncbi:MAG TPA: PAS domain-containing protein [Chryseosolibacter sp.]
MKRITLITRQQLSQITSENHVLKNDLEAATEFVNQITAGNFAVQCRGTTVATHLTTALEKLRDKTANLHKEEKQRNWVNEGLAKFAELLRIHQQDKLEDVFYKVVSNLVNYLAANQGAIFLAKTQSETEGLELISCYAYQKRKYVTRQLAPGEGLAGQCFLEKDVIYLTEVPDNYIKITSGLGEALPRCILLVPLLNDGACVGVIEIASFTRFELFQIDFIRKVAESIASAYTNIRINAHTQYLLNESRMQAEALKSQEEEMRQNMEELTASQEELKRIQLETDAQNKIFNSMAIVSKTDVRGNITYVNEEFLKWSKYTREEVIGKNHRILKSGHQADSLFKELWDTISSGRMWRGEVKNRAKDGTYYWVDAIIAPVLDHNGLPKEYISQRFVINEKKEKEEKMNLILQESQAKEEELRQNMEELQAQQEELQRIHREIEAQTTIINSTAIVSRTDARGNITYVNDEFVKWSKYSREDVIGKNHRILKSGHQADEIFHDLWKTISSGKTWRGEVKNKAKDGSYYWVDAIIAPVLDSAGKPKEYIAQRFVINEKKNKEETMRKILAETEAQTKIINSIAIVSKTDLRGNITFVNDEFVKWSKYRPEEVLGKNHRLLKSGDQPDEIFEDLWKTISNGKIWRGKVKNKAKDGSFYWVDAIIAPVLDENGKPKEYIAQRFVIKDTEQRLIQL